VARGATGKHGQQIPGLDHRICLTRGRGRAAEVSRRPRSGSPACAGCLPAAGSPRRGNELVAPRGARIPGLPERPKEACYKSCAAPGDPPPRSHAREPLLPDPPPRSGSAARSGGTGRSGSRHHRRVARPPRRGRRAAALPAGGLSFDVRLLHPRAPPLRGCRLETDPGRARGTKVPGPLPGPGRRPTAPECGGAVGTPPHRGECRRAAGGGREQDQVRGRAGSGGAVPAARRAGPGPGPVTDRAPWATCPGASRSTCPGACWGVRDDHRPTCPGDSWRTCPGAC